jgi:hypothetical protein
MKLYDFRSHVIGRRFHIPWCHVRRQTLPPPPSELPKVQIGSNRHLRVVARSTSLAGPSGTLYLRYIIPQPLTIVLVLATPPASMRVRQYQRAVYCGDTAV